MGLTSQIITLFFPKPPLTRTSRPRGSQRGRAELPEDSIVSGPQTHAGRFLASASRVLSREGKAET